MFAYLKRKKKTIFLVFLLIVLLTPVVVYFCNRAVDNAAKGKLYSRLEEVPYNKTGLLLGTGKFLKSGRLNPYYTYRIHAASELLRSGKIRYLVISGDNSRKNYNEPVDMKNDLVKAGIDSSCIYLDYAGFRTFDSMVRFREIFGQTSVTIISQQFHNERALFIAAHEGISAIGFNARDVGKKMGFRTRLREKLARVKVFVDYFTGAEPKFLGPKVIIPA